MIKSKEKLCLYGNAWDTWDIITKFMFNGGCDMSN